MIFKFNLKMSEKNNEYFNSDTDEFDIISLP